MSGFRRIHRRQDGASMVEAAFVLPILILLVFGIAEFARGYNARVTLTHAAREGVREYSISKDAASAENVAEASAPSLDPAQMSFSFTACNPGQPAQLTITYPFTYDIPLFGTNTIALSGIGVMRCNA